jgi:hypothetical protein
MDPLGSFPQKTCHALMTKVGFSHNFGIFLKCVIKVGLKMCASTWENLGHHMATCDWPMWCPINCMISATSIVHSAMLVVLLYFHVSCTICHAIGLVNTTSLYNFPLHRPIQCHITDLVSATSATIRLSQSTRLCHLNLLTSSLYFHIS